LCNAHPWILACRHSQKHVPPPWSVPCPWGLRQRWQTVVALRHGEMAGTQGGGGLCSLSFPWLGDHLPPKSISAPSHSSAALVDMGVLSSGGQSPRLGCILNTARVIKPPPLVLGRGTWQGPRDPAASSAHPFAGYSAKSLQASHGRSGYCARVGQPGRSSQPGGLV
jgi:hypothetical protein